MGIRSICFETFGLGSRSEEKEVVQEEEYRCDICGKVAYVTNESDDDVWKHLCRRHAEAMEVGHTDFNVGDLKETVLHFLADEEVRGYRVYYEDICLEVDTGHIERNVCPRDTMYWASDLMTIERLEGIPSDLIRRLSKETRKTRVRWEPCTPEYITACRF